MRSVSEMQDYIRSRSDAELLAEFEVYRSLWRQGKTDVFLELLAIEIDSRKLKRKSQ